MYRKTSLKVQGYIHFFPHGRSSEMKYIIDVNCYFKLFGIIKNFKSDRMVHHFNYRNYLTLSLRPKYGVFYLSKRLLQTKNLSLI